MNIDATDRVDAIEQIFNKLNEPPYRRNQVYEGIYKKHSLEFDKLTNIPKALRQELCETFGEKILSLNKIKEISGDQVTKVLFETKEKNRFETVLMKFNPNPSENRSNSRTSLCVSSQSGCALACKFCTTGTVGLKQNLTADEITDQILYFLQNGKTVDSVSFMGMGEPFANNNFFRALSIITDKDKLAFPQRSINVSTVGLIPGINNLKTTFPGINLTFSLHTPFQKQRLELMPVSKAYGIDGVMSALNNFILATNKRVFIAYLLLSGVNDSPRHANALSQLIKRQGGKSYLYHVNLIRFNPTSQVQSFMAPSIDEIRRFQNILNSQGISNTLRHSFGVKIDAACGQLYADYTGIRT